LHKFFFKFYRRLWRRIALFAALRQIIIKFIPFGAAFGGVIVFFGLKSHKNSVKFGCKITQKICDKKIKILTEPKGETPLLPVVSADFLERFGVCLWGDFWVCVL